MSRRKLQWQAKARKIGPDEVYRTLPVKTLGEGRKAMMLNEKTPSPNPNSGAGKVVSLPISARKRGLVEKWAKMMK